MSSMLGAGRLLLAHGAALTVAGCVIALRWAIGADRPVPAGLVIIGGSVVVIAAVRRPLTAVVGLVAALLVVVNMGWKTTGWTVALGIALAVALLTGTGSVVAWAADRRRSVSHSTIVGCASAVGLLLLSPVCAEYLAAYDDSTGHPWQLVGNLVVFVPLYGCAALLIREGARRTRIGWVGVLFFGVAFGVVQAGLVDQSLFSPDYRGIDGWDQTYRTTLIAPLGISAVNAIGFVSGHAIVSISAPIALVEATRPGEAMTPWLRPRGMVASALVYVAGSIFVLRYHLQTETWHARPGQLIGAGAVAAACVAAAFVFGRRRTRRRPGRTVRLPALLIGALLLALVNATLPQTWTGVGLRLGVFMVAATATIVLSRRQGWTSAHAALLAAGPLLSTAALAFTYPPLVGELALTAKYAHNAVMAAVVVAATILAVLRRTVAGRQPEPNQRCISRDPVRRSQHRHPPDGRC